MLSKLRTTTIALALSLVALASTACGGLSYELKGKAPAIGAIARIAGDTQEETKTTRLTIEVDFLQPPADLAPSATGFVVWYRKDSKSQWRKLGSLEYDVDSRKAGLAEITVAEMEFELIVSVEGDAPVAPSSVIVLSQLIPG